MENKFVIETYKQQNMWARAYMNLRYKHFLTFTFLITFIFVCANLESMKNIHFFIKCFGAVMTLLFWSLDFRTGKLLKKTIATYKKIEVSCASSENETVKTKKIKWLKASNITNCIFLTILACWVLLLFV